MNGLDTFVVVSVIIMVLVGAGLVGGGVWQLRRGPVTAREAVTWRHTMRRRRIIDPPEEMRPRLTDAFVLAWRRYWAGFWLGGGIGLIVAGIAYLAISFALPPADYDSRKLSTLVFGLTLLGGSGAGACLGNLWGFSTMRRDAHDPQPQHRLGEYRSCLAPMLLAVVLLGASIFAAYAAAQALAIASSTPRLGDYPPSPPVFVITPIWLLILVLVLEGTSRRLAALPPLAMPLESPLAAPFDEKLKSLVVVSTYLSIGSWVFLGCSQLATYPLNVVMGAPFNDHASSVSMVILACWIPYLILVLAGPHPIRQFRERRAQRRAAVQAG